jgi:hypothetical protein
MKYPRITIAELMFIVLVTAIGLAAIRSGSPAWAGAMLSITIFAMICSLLGVALRRAQRRAYWLGFATLGWSYLLIMYVPWLHANVGQFLLALNLFEYLEEIVHPEPSPAGGLQSLPLGVLAATVTAGGFDGPTGAAALSNFVRIGMAMEALLWAFLGGRVASYFASERDRESTPPIAASARTPEADQQRRGDDIIPGGSGPPR